MKKLLTALVVIVSMGTASSVCAADFAKGWSAYKAGDYATALRAWTPLAEQGHAPAQTSLGVMYGKGQGVRQNHKTAVKWYRLAAEQGYIAAQASLGVMYGTGQGVRQDNLYAHMWGNIAASNGNVGGRKLLDLIVNQMTPDQIGLAQKIAQRCIRKKFKGC